MGIGGTARPVGVEGTPAMHLRAHFWIPWPAASAGVS